MAYTTMDEWDSNVMTATALLFVVSVALYRYIIHPAVFSPLARIPSAHWSCSVSPAWILWARFRSQENGTLYTAHQKYGPIVQIAPNEVSVNDMDAVRTVYQGGFDKHEWYSVFNNYGVPCTFAAQEAKHHSLRKRMVSHVYSKSFIHSSAALAAQSHAILNSRLLPSLESLANENKGAITERTRGVGMDVHSLFAGVVLDLITSYCFGLQKASANFTLRSGYREHWLALYKARKGYGFFEQELPRLSRLARLFGINLTPKWVDAANKELEADHLDLCKRAIESLQDPRASTAAQGTAGDPVVVRAILAGMDKEAESSGAASPIYSTALLQRELSVASETFDHVLAGQETTGVTLTYLSWHLSRSQELQSELRQELRSLDLRSRHSREEEKEADGSRDTATTTLPHAKQLDNLPILHAVITETVRRYAPAGGPEPRITPHPSCKIGPYEIPGGVRISASVYNLHRDDKYFPEPEAWDHTRWLFSDGDTEDAEREGAQRRRQFWGFSSGGRMCLGSNFAMHEMKLLIASIYSNYSSHIVNDDGIEPTDGYTAHPKSGQLWLRFEKL